MDFLCLNCFNKFCTGGYIVPCSFFDVGLCSNLRGGLLFTVGWFKIWQPFSWGFQVYRLIWFVACLFFAGLVWGCFYGGVLLASDC